MLFKRENPARILVTDDDPTIVMLIRLRLLADGFHVLTARDGREAFDKVRQEKPDLVILDEMMPGLTGYQLIKKIRGLPGLVRHVPMIITSSLHTMKHVFDDLAIHAFIPKPFEAKELMKQVESALAGVAEKRKRPIQTVMIRGKGRQVTVVGIEPEGMSKVVHYLQTLGYDVSIHRDRKNSLTFALSKTIAT